MKEIEEFTTKVKLNIAMSYPVHWSRYAVMRDYIQNFFDAVGPEQFHDKFEYKYEDMKLSMSTPTGFEKEWLFFMGTSTKRDSDTTHAGRFGEGFKIASLVAYRDMKLQICMESRGWSLKVTEVDDIIDGKQVKLLAYEVSAREYEENATLTLEGVNDEQYDSFLSAMKSFYYKGNPRFGKMISCGENYAVYHSNMQADQKYRRGYLYAAYQERYDFGLPIIVCHHTYVPYTDDRDREEFSERDTKWCIKEVLSDILSYDNLPKCEIVLNPEVALEGCAATKKVKGKLKEQSGLKVESEISKVHLQKYLFQEACFGEAFSVYAHELLHQYGGDASIQFHKALLMMNKRIIEKSKKLDEYELRWRGVA